MKGGEIVDETTAAADLWWTIFSARWSTCLVAAQTRKGSMYLWRTSFFDGHGLEIVAIHGPAMGIGTVAG